MDNEFQIPKGMNDAVEQSLSQSWNQLVGNYMSSSKPFSFDTIENFDEHISQSIPNYHLLNAAINDLSTFFTKEYTQVVDLGCSTGTLLEQIPFNGDKIGIDTSKNLIPRSHDNVEYVEKDIRFFKNFGRCSLITSIFTIQFISKEDRATIIERVYESLVEGGAFIWAEKVQQETGLMERIMQNAHYDFKRRHFLPSQIMDKERDLRSIMNCNTQLENHLLIENAGFSQYTTFWKFYNFEAYLCIK